MKFQYLNHAAYSHVIKRSKRCQIDLSVDLRNLLNHLIEGLKPRTETTIRQMCDRSGKTKWGIFNPTTQSYVYRSSEDDVRAYLESRYYQ